MAYEVYTTKTDWRKKTNDVCMGAAGPSDIFAKECHHYHRSRRFYVELLLIVAMSCPAEACLAHILY